MSFNTLFTHDTPESSSMGAQPNQRQIEYRTSSGGENIMAFATEEDFIPNTWVFKTKPHVTLLDSTPLQVHFLAKVIEEPHAHFTDYSVTQRQDGYHCTCNTKTRVCYEPAGRQNKVKITSEGFGLDGIHGLPNSTLQNSVCSADLNLKGMTGMGPDMFLTVISQAIESLAGQPPKELYLVKHSAKNYFDLQSIDFSAGARAVETTVWTTGGFQLHTYPPSPAKPSSLFPPASGTQNRQSGEVDYSAPRPSYNESFGRLPWSNAELGNP
ncbi:hypothetical protein TREMEDRAFT_62463 [Tremella mesenterica DSM 1558]|uniref:uncharacterized protein n=1 Tax=Tremella mesenterica (strain ATCC 24925 / CBS 8224 / DSM 1558 / NBRC 9311 / NRRL Y-6157 / RJB 2259-6 / UBC 559-6) TaxID=578456 RepID=UPI0003F49CC4|nr:uncharacterized protein TREMEDRAFT_62463 [Tremella mesenterica DSM 1558]EIW69603.1 hypothetical protein TREMEDRAFT_62463 [Tremella mesenterica DSM 1558]